MQLFSELDIVNKCLASMGELPITSLENTSPFVPAALSLLSAETLSFQEHGWYFNTEDKALPVATNGEVILPTNAITVIPKDTLLTTRNGKLYNLRTNSFNIGAAKVVRIVTFVPFNELPVSAQRVIAANTVFQFQNNYVASSASAALLQAEANNAMVNFLRENTKALRVNILTSGSIGRKRYNLANPMAYHFGRGF